MIAAIDLGDVLWSLLVLYVMVMYLVAVFVVILDLVRSDDLSGVTKALWFIALLVLPIAALVGYLVVRGDGIGMRNLARATTATPTDVDLRTIPPPPLSGPASELEKAKRLLDEGMLSRAEFDQLKLKLIS